MIKNLYNHFFGKPRESILNVIESVNENDWFYTLYCCSHCKRTGFNNRKSQDCLSIKHFRFRNTDFILRRSERSILKVKLMEFENRKEQQIFDEMNRTYSSTKDKVSKMFNQQDDI